jgi:general secretion pathway protein D
VRTRLALPILLTSASIMMSGIALSIIGSARAQDTPTVTRPPRVRPPGEAPNAPETGAEGSKIAPFRTGLEERDDARPTPPGARVSFNLEDADLPDLVRLVARITGKRFILPAKARSIKATIYSPTDVTAAEAYQAFLSILALNGMMLEPSGRYFKVVESAASQTKAGTPLLQDGQAMPGDDRFVTRMHRLENVAAEDVATLLNNFKTEAGTITAYAPTNTLIITDTGTSIQRMLRIVGEIDIPRTGEQIWIEPVHYAGAEEMAETLTEIFPTDDGAGGGGAAAGGATKARGAARAGKAPVTREGGQEGEAGGGTSTVGARTGESRVRAIIPDERSNQLVIVATERAYLRILEVMRVLDQPVEGEGGVHIYRLQYADSEVMAETLSSLVDGGGSAAGAGGAGGKAPRRAAAAAGEATAGAVSGALTGEISIQAHKDTNSLLITATAQDYASLRRVIDRLDVVPRQVFIEAVIMELSVSRTSKLGLNYHGGLPEPVVDGDAGLSVLGFGAASSIGFPASALAGDTLTGLALGVRGPALEIPGIGLSVPSFGVVLSALARSSDVDVLSTPHLLAMDNTEAEINVGANVPLQTSGVPFGGGAGLGGLIPGLGGAAGQGAAGAAGLAGLAGLAGGMGGGFGGAARQSVGTIIRITPHINDAGEIRMEIEEEISEAGDALPGNLGAIPINQRIAKTQVLVRDQQTVVIGGLMRDRVSTSETKIPILGDIPILGALFRTTERQTTKTNLLLFLTPYVIRTPDDLRAIFERKMRERQEFIDRFFVFGDHDYDPPLDYSRTRGLLGEIFLELDALDEERALFEELRTRAPPEHRARAPLGTHEGGDPGGDVGDTVIEADGETTVVVPEQAPTVIDSGGMIEVVPPQQ